LDVRWPRVGSRSIISSIDGGCGSVRFSTCAPPP
jgi:hypothetical protein